MCAINKKSTIPRSSTRQEFINSLEKTIGLFDNMSEKFENQQMLINIERIPEEAFDIFSISATYNNYVEQLIEIFNDDKNIKLLVNYTNSLENSPISKLKIKNTLKIIQKYSQEMDLLQKNNKKLKNVENQLNEEGQKKKELNKIKSTHTTLKQICKKYKKCLAENDNVTPMTLNHILSTKNKKGLFLKLCDIKFKIEKIIDVYCTNKLIQSQEQGFFAKVINSIKSFGNYFSRKYRIHKIFNYIKKNEKGISKSIQKIVCFFKNIKKNIESSELESTENFDKNFTYINLKEIFKNLKYKIRDIYSKPGISTTKNIKKVMYEAFKSNRMPESKNERNIFSCLICIKMINYLFTVINIEDNLGNIKKLSKIKLKQITNLKSAFEILKVVVTILSIMVTIASFVLPLLGVVGTPLWGALISIKL